MPKWLSTTLATIGGVYICLCIAANWPSSNTDRAKADRVKCQIHLRMIGLAIQRYHIDFGGAYPESFQSLLLAEQLSSTLFVCPASNDASSTAPTTQAEADEMSTPGHLSYIYLGKGLTDKTVLPNQVIAYEPLANHGDGIDVLLGDGTAKFVDAKKAAKIISDANAGKRPVMLPP